LIRDSDIYIDLRERMEAARQAEADIFVSIHADAINHENAHGSSVYALSMDGATSEAAQWLAQRENKAAALHGNIALEDLDDGLAKTLINLTQGNTMERSIEAGSYVLNELVKIGPVHKKTVEQAAFAVLKSPDIPSILIETAFISNREEEKKLNNPRYQESLANAIASGLYNYLQQRAPIGSYLASKRLKNGS
jgi:N-acetylmuramoyl-L-alanine amidase